MAGKTACGCKSAEIRIFVLVEPRRATGRPSLVMLGMSESPSCARRQLGWIDATEEREGVPRPCHRQPDPDGGCHVHEEQPPCQSVAGENR
jgi:hypothetical protein